LLEFTSKEIYSIVKMRQSIVLSTFLCVACTCIRQNVPDSTYSPAQWSVKSTNNFLGEGSRSFHCLLLSGNITVELVPVSLKENSLLLVSNNTWVVPVNATVQGDCGEAVSEMSLEWLDQETEDMNLLNFVITREGRLAGLTGIFLRLQEREMTSQLDPYDGEVLEWPVRYGLDCSVSVRYPLFHAPDPFLSSLVLMTPYEDKPKLVAYIIIENLKLEAFRELSLVDQFPESMALEFYRRKWECEFHIRFFWAPIVVSGALLCLLCLMLGVIFCKSSLGCNDSSRNDF